MKRNDGESCSGCYFGERNPQQIGSYFCKKNAPTAVAVPGQGGLAVMTVFPPMQAEGWCGQFQKAPPQLVS